jgi:hypothetical protein
MAQLDCTPKKWQHQALAAMLRALRRAGDHRHIDDDPAAQQHHHRLAEHDRRQLWQLETIRLIREAGPHLTDEEIRFAEQMVQLGDHMPTAQQISELSELLYRRKLVPSQALIALAAALLDRTAHKERPARDAGPAGHHHQP